ncbi:MAG: hypothetical protein AAF367_03835 [Pseudomonadota bacterium]
MFGAMKVVMLTGLILVTAACTPPGNARRAGLDGPLRDEYVQIVSVDRRGVEVDASGQIVRALAPDGMCIPTDSVQTSPLSVFLLMRDCSEGVERFGGVLSLSISNGPTPGGLDGLAAFMTTEAGLLSLGHGGDLEDMTLIDVRTEKGAVFAVVEDRSEFGPAFAGDTICRAFVELNGRMTVVSLLSLREAPQSADVLRDRLGEVVEALHQSNV